MTFSIWGSNDTRHGRMMSADITWIINSIDTGHKTLGIYMNSNSSTFVILQYVGIQVFDELETPDGPMTPTNTNSNNYSETEQIIGTWIDGKPIYRKAFQHGLVNLNNPKTIKIDGDYKNITDEKHYFLAPDGGCLMLPILTKDHSYFAKVNTSVSGTTGALSFELLRSDLQHWSDWNLLSVVEYTKRTD